MSENTIDAKHASNVDLYEHVTDRPESHLKEVLRLVNAINTAVAEGKIVSVEQPGVMHSTIIAGAFPLYDEVVCIQHCPFPRDGSPDVPVFWFPSGVRFLARYSCDTTVDVLCGSYVCGKDIRTLKSIKK